MISWMSSHIVLVEGTIVAFLVALSLQIPLRAGVFSFAGIATYAIGAYTAVLTVTRLDASPLVALGIGVGLSLGFSFLLALVVRRLSGFYLALATVAVVLIVQVIAVNGGSLTGGSTGVFGAINDFSALDGAIIALVVAIAVGSTERGMLGRRIEAVREDPELALSVGIDVNRVRLAAFVVSGVVGSLGGGMAGLFRTTVAPSSIGFELLVIALTVTILGGFRSWVGPAIGAAFVTWLPFLLQATRSYQQIIFGVMVLGAAIFVPDGMLGIIQKVNRWIAARLDRNRVNHWPSSNTEASEVREAESID